MYKTRLRDIVKKATAVVTGGAILGAPALAERAEAKLHEQIHNTVPIAYNLDRIPSAIDTLINNAPDNLEARQYSAEIPKLSSIDNMLSSPFAGYAVGKDVFIQYKDDGATLYTFKEHSRPLILKDGRIVTALDDSRAKGIESEPRKRGSILKPVGIVLGIIAIAGVVYYICCSRKPEDEKIMIQAGTNVVETDDNSQAVSNSTIKYTYNGNTVTASPGQLVDIAEINKGTTANVQIQVEAANHLTRKINSEPMTGTHNYTINIKDLTGIDMEHFINNMASDGYFTRLKPPSDKTLNVYFNADYAGTEKTLPQDWIDETKRVFNEIKKRSNGEITSIVYHENGNKKGGEIPNDGEIYVYYDSSINGVANATWENSDGSIKALKLYFNSSKASTDRAESEILDSVLAKGEQNFLRKYWNYVDFVFKRPTGNNYKSYRIYKTHEEQKEIDTTYAGSSRKLGTLTTTNYNNRNFPGFNSVTGPSAPKTRKFTPAKRNHNNQKRPNKKEIKK